MNWLKIITRSGRQSIVRELLKDYLTPAKIAEVATEATARAITAGANNLTDERCAQIAVGCERGGNALIHITAAISPDSEEGKAISVAEKAQICADITIAVESLLTQDGVDKQIETIVGYVK